MTPRDSALQMSLPSIWLWNFGLRRQTSSSVEPLLRQSPHAGGGAVAAAVAALRRCNREPLVG